MSRPHRAITPEYEFEAQLGLPEALPAGERIIWQGAPDWRVLAVQAFHIRKLAVYFTLILMLRAAFVAIEDGAPATQIFGSVMPLLPLALAAVAIAALMAWLTARTTLYTVTDRRVVMRIGIVLTLSLNLPYSKIGSAALKRNRSGTRGDIALTLMPGDKIAWMHLWPHSRPWQFSHPQPMLRALPEATLVAALLTGAWAQINAAAQPDRVDVVPLPAFFQQPDDRLRSGQQPAWVP